MKELSPRETQLAELNILDYFDQICRKNGLRYSLAGGTLLGAIRHKGFIPWDDDIDVCMPRSDYERFVRLFREDSRYLLSCDRGRGIEYPFVKMMDRRISVKQDKIKEAPYCCIDVFPIDGFPAEDQEASALIKKAKFYRSVCAYAMLNDYKVYEGKRSPFVFYIGRLFSCLYTRRRALYNLLKLAQKYSFDSSEFVGCVVWGLYGIGERMLKSEFEKFVDVEFEGHTFKAMSCWDSYLTGIYGDYMQLPPEEKRITHGFKAYRIEEEHE